MFDKNGQKMGQKWTERCTPCLLLVIQCTSLSLLRALITRLVNFGLQRPPAWRGCSINKYSQTNQSERTTVALIITLVLPLLAYLISHTANREAQSRLLVSCVWQGQAHHPSEGSCQVTLTCLFSAAMRYLL